MNGEGKGWAKGRTAATDARVARNAERHRGMRYERHLTPEQDKRYRQRTPRTLPLAWSPVMAYAVGLMATDGCLVNTGRHLSFGSSDEALVQTFLNCLGRQATYQTLTTETGAPYFRCQFGDIRFYEWLQGVGLCQRKSLVLGAIAVPDALLLDLARGLLDGDGSVINYWYDGSGKARGRRYEGLLTRFISASRMHIEWLHAALLRTTGIRGAVSPPATEGVCWTLNFAIGGSMSLLPLLYPREDVPKLDRKWSVWKAYSLRHGHMATFEEIEAGGEGRNTVALIGRATRDSKGRFRTLSRSANSADGEGATARRP